MAIPSGSGTEVLKRVAGHLENVSTTVLTVATNHIYTIKSIFLCETDDASCIVRIRVHDGTDMKIILNDTVLGRDESFVWNDVFVMTSGDYLGLQEIGNSQMSYWITYIDQDWT